MAEGRISRNAMEDETRDGLTGLQENPIGGKIYSISGENSLIDGVLGNRFETEQGDEIFKRKGSGTERPSGLQALSDIAVNISRSGRGDNAKRTSGAAERKSANTLDAVSEIHLDTAEPGPARASEQSVRESLTPLSERSPDENPKEASSSDFLSASSNVGFGGIKLTKIPQEVVQKANEMYRALEAESLKTVEMQKSDSKVVAVEIQQPAEQRELKVVLEGDVDKTFYLNCSNVHQAKEALAQQLKVIPKNVVLRANGRILRENDGIENVGDVAMELSYDELDESPREVQVQEKIVQPKVVQVKILQQDGTWKYAEVAVMHFGSRKQYMGGYRDKRTGRVYYHSVCQTEPKQRAVKSFTREVQANLPTVDFGVNTSQATATQTSKAPSPAGKILSARPYVPYNEIRKTMVPHRAAQVIQNAWRKYIFRKFVLKHFKKLAASLQDRANDLTSAWETVQKRRVQNVTAAVFPSFRIHFSDSLAYFNLWATREAGRLADRKTGFARKAAMAELLRQEQQILYVLETQRLKAVEENLRKQDIMFLEGTARSRARIYDKGNVTLVDDLNVQKAGVLKEIFAGYSRTDATPAERLEMLNGVRGSLLNEFGINHPTVTDLLEILDREIDLITIGFPRGQMVYLHKRFETLFLHLARDPEVNPQAKYYRKSHLTERKYAIRRCKLCNKNLPSSLMFRHVRMKKFRACMSCAQLEQNVAPQQLNLAPYKRMLSALRNTELEKNCRSAIPFLLQPLGTYFLVNVIWNGKSVLSGNQDLTQLRITRWLPDEDWSVWNMILLTAEEVTEHERVPYPLTHYPEDLILQVRTKNILGRMNFMYLVDIDKDFKFDRPSIGTLPRDHLLYTNKHHEKYAPSNEVPAFLKRAT